jgi:glucose/arabinose dehydrogenase
MFVADSKADQVRIYRLDASGGKPAASGIYASGLHQPYGIAFYPLDDPKWVYIANSHSVVHFPCKKGDLKAQGDLR